MEMAFASNAVLVRIRRVVRVEEFAAVVAGGEVGPALEGDGEGGFGAVADAVGYGGDVVGAIEE
jgi:hypothetical protein